MENNKREWPPVRRPRRRGFNIRPVAMVLALVLLVGAAVGGTVAWLTSTPTPVVNTFTAANVEISLAETKTNFKMVPGCTIEKDPKVTVNESKTDVDIYLFVKIEQSANYNDYMEDYKLADGWTELGSANPGVYYREVKTTDNTKEFFVLKDNKVVVRDTVTKTMMEAIDGVVADGQAATADEELGARPTLTFTAYAIQKPQTGTAAEAWAKLSSP